MANKKFFAVILVMALVFGMVLVGCSDDGGSDPLNGTWIFSDGGMQLKLDNGSFELSENGTLEGKGTYTTSGNNITVILTHIWGPALGIEAKWYTKDELRALGVSDADLNAVFMNETFTYSLNGDKLTLGDDVLTRKK